MRCYRMEDWIKQYVNLYTMDGTELNGEEIDKAKLLKFDHMPSKFYKYREFDEGQYSIKNFEDDTIWMTTPSRYNDPYDSAATITFGKKQIDNLKKTTIEMFKKNGNLELTEDDEKILYEFKDMKSFRRYLMMKDKRSSEENIDVDELNDAIENAINKEFDRLNEQLTESFQTSILSCSFSEVNHSILMWSHYAKYHTGFCIEYDFKQLGQNHHITRMMLPIIYTDKLFDFTPYTQDINKFNCLMSSYVTMEKSTEWQYEREWRLAISWGPSAEPFAKPVPTPTAVYLGAKISAENEKLIIDIAKKKSIPVYKMKMKSNEFKLISEKIA